MDQTPTINQIECRYCSEPINATAKKCKHCGEILDPQMREIAYLKTQKASPNVFMNAGGGAASGATNAEPVLRRFPHWIHIIGVILTGLLWLPFYILMYAFRNRRYYI